MNNSENVLTENFSTNNQLEDSFESTNRSLSSTTEEKAQAKKENEIDNLKQKIDYYEKHLSILLSKYQETTNKFIIFRDFFLNHQNNNGNDISTVLQRMGTFQNSEEMSQISSLLEENSQLRVNFKRSTELLKQQKEVINKLKNSNKELNSFIEMMSIKDFPNQRIEELVKENKDLQSLYEMMVNESDELSTKNQALRDQIENYKSKEDKLRKENKSLQQKIFDLEDELMNLKFSNDTNNKAKSNVINKNLNRPTNDISNKSKAALDISSSISFTFSEESSNEIQVHLPIPRSDCDNKHIIEELEVKSNYLESELDKTSENLNKMIKQNEILKQDHKKHWINLKNAKVIIDKYKDIERSLREKLKSAGVEIPNYEQPIFEEL